MRYISKPEAKKMFCSFCPYQEKDCNQECHHPLDDLDYIDIRIGESSKKKNKEEK